MLDDAQIAAAEAAVRKAGDEIVVPLFGALAVGDIEEKTPGDLVTIADRRTEELLSRELSLIVPGSRVVGEEAVHTDPDVLKVLAGPDPVWIIDPIDGTEAFATGSPRFSVLVALAHNGQLLASWTYAPLLKFMATATHGSGAFVNGRRIRVSPTPSGLEHLDVVLPQPKWWSAEQRTQFNGVFATGVSPSFFDYAGLHYVELASGRRSAMIMPWEYPWDHAAGLLLHAEAGGIVIDMNARPFDITGGNELPVIAAPDRRTAIALRDALLTTS